jgi:BirA family biotin operon repressor/biotin-[acetyl-CoA-carboxylase] ligase
MQTAGRGRQGRHWQSAAGNFFGSTLVIVRAGDPPPTSLSLAAGLALVETLDVAVPGQPLMLKWPNDVLMNGRKLAGILLERSGDRIVVGFGVNLASAPELADRPVASLGGKIATEAFAPLLAASFARLVALWRGAQPKLLAQAWMARAHPIGTALTVHSAPDETIGGRFDGLESDGALRLWTASGLQIVRAGDVDLG